MCIVSAVAAEPPGPEITAQYTAANALVAPSLGRSLSGNAANVTVGLVSPFSLSGEQSNQVDLRFGKTLRIDRARATLNFDLFNPFNASPVLAQNNNFGAWQQADA